MEDLDKELAQLKLERDAARKTITRTRKRINEIISQKKNTYVVWVHQGDTRFSERYATKSVAIGKAVHYQNMAGVVRVWIMQCGHCVWSSRGNFSYLELPVGV